MHLPLFEGEDELRLRAWVQLTRTFLNMQRRLMMLLAQAEVTLPQFDVLATLRFSEGVTQQELAERLLVTKGNICGILDRLEEIAWVERRRDVKDRRANRLHLTPIGRRQIDALLPQHDRMVITTLKPMPSQDVARLRHLLEAWEHATEGA